MSVVHESLDIGSEVLTFVSDAPGSPGGWALTRSEASPTQLAMVRVPAASDEGDTEPLPLGLELGEAPAIELRRGATPGTGWLIYDRPTSTRLIRLEPLVGGAMSNAMIANFPPVGGGPECPTRWARELLLIEGRPFILALPDCSESPGLEMHLLELDANSGEFIGSWVLSFDPCVGYSDPVGCAVALAYRIASVGPADSTHIPEAERISVGFTQVRAFDGIGSQTETPVSADISLLDLRMTPTGPDARLITFREVWFDDLGLGPVRLAQDPYSVQLHVRRGQEAVLLRFDTITEFYLQIESPDQLPLDGGGELTQLFSYSAMVDVQFEGGQGELSAVSLLDIESWPEWEPRSSIQLDDLVGAEPAGAGTLLLRRSEAPPQIVELACVE